MSDQQIQSISKEKFKSLVKEKTRQAAFQYLKNIQRRHPKMDGLVYNKFEEASYISSPLFQSESVQLLLALRTRTVRGIKNDF